MRRVRGGEDYDREGRGDEEEGEEDGGEGEEEGRGEDGGGGVYGGNVREREGLGGLGRGLGVD